MAEAVKIIGLEETLRGLRQIDRKAASELNKELKIIAVVVQQEAKVIAGAKGLAPPGASGRGTGGLVSSIRVFAAGNMAGVRETATRKGYPYPAIYEYGKGGARAFLNPAFDNKAGEVERLVGDMLDRLTSEAGFGRGGVL